MSDPADTAEQELEKYLSKKNYATKNDIKHIESHLSEQKKETTPEHIHATHSYDKFCPGCGGPNPDFKEPDLFCKDCDHPVEKESAVCPGCGGKDAYAKDD